MAWNTVYETGATLTLPVAQTVKSGDPVKVGGILGVAQIDAYAGQDNANYYTTVKTNGVHKVTVTAGALAEGAAVYIAADGTLSTTDTDTLFGYLVRPKATTDTTAFVVIGLGA